MTAAVVTGLIVGFGALGVRVSLFPRPEPLAIAMDRFKPRSAPPAPDPGLRWDNRLGAVAIRRVPPVERLVTHVGQDLRILRRRPEDLAGETIVYGLYGLILGPWLGLCAWLLAGAPLPAAVSGAMSLVGATAAALSPWLTLRDRARRRRSSFRLALAAYCYVADMSLASGRGVEQSLATGAEVGEGWMFDELRACLAAGSMRGETPWESLDLLGHELGVDDLVQLAATIGMAGEDGAAVRETISTKARTLNERIASEAEQRTQRATAQMGLPAVAIAAGFVVFLGYPAVAALLSAF